MTTILAYADDSAAYLATDSGVYDLNSGAIVQFLPKVLVFESVRMVLCASGSCFYDDVMEAMQAEILIGTQAGFVTALPRVCRRLRDMARIKKPVLEAAGQNMIRVVAATYDPGEGGSVFEVSTDNGYQIVEGARLIQPVLAPAVLDRIFPDEVPRDRRQAQRFFIEARRIVHPDMAGGCVVAGDCDLYRVGPEGVTFETIVSFPDKVGAVPDRRRAGKLLA